jgi:hypothetical protein
MFHDMYEGQVTSTMRALHLFVSAPPDSLYDDEFCRHWEGLTREEREAELLKLIQFATCSTRPT